MLERVADDLPPGSAHAEEILTTSAAALRDTRRPGEARLAVALASDVSELLTEHPLRDHPAESRGWPVRVERARALFGSWYEFFPRSEGARYDPPRSGTFADAALRLPAIADMGFDVVYLPPIHPIGRVNRKAGTTHSNRAPTILALRGRSVHRGRSRRGPPGPGDHGRLRGLCRDRADNGLEVALDLALQAAPDHPWVAEHPEWFTTADGSIAYAENPPKKYQDIYPDQFRQRPGGHLQRDRPGRPTVDGGRGRIFRSTTRTPNRCGCGTG